ncbi:MAG: NrfD/PsrC family molybdoenzyme membrane anchor subunit [Candidatus Binataceae bacterium]
MRARRTTKAPPWHGWVAADVFLSSLSAGTFIVAALAILTRPIMFSTIARIAMLAAFPLILADIICLLADLGDPLRFHHMLRVFKLRSPMSVGVWAIVVFSMIAFAAFAAVILDMRDPIVRALAAIGLVPALFVAGYKGVLFSVTAQPGWRAMRWLGAEFSISATAMGAALMLLDAWVTGDPIAAAIIRTVTLWLLIPNAILIVMLQFAAAGGPPRKSKVWVELVLFLVAGIAAPIVSILLSDDFPNLDLVTAILVIGGGFVARRHMVKMPHHPEEFGARSDPESRGPSQAESGAAAPR